MIRGLVKNIIYEVFNNLIIENFDNVKKIKDTYYPNLNLDDSHLQSIYAALKENQVLKSNFINWIFLLIKNNVPRILEDIDIIAKNIKKFNSYSRQISQDGYPTELYKKNGELVYKNPRELYRIVANYGEVNADEEKRLLIKGKYLVSKGEASLIYEDSNFVVYSPKTYEASKELACLSQWCTRFPNMYQNYSSQGPLYIIFNKKTLGSKDKNRMIQFHIPSRQFKDALNAELPYRKEFMNNLKKLFSILYPNALNEFQKLSNGEITKDELSDEAKESRYILPLEYFEKLDLPCEEIQEKIAKELGVECYEVEESDNGYAVGGEIYTVQTVESATDQAIDSILGSGLDAEWFIKNILPDYSWNDVYPKEKTNVAKEIENEFGDDYENLYYDYFEDYFDGQGIQLTDDEIESGEFLNQIDYETFIDLMQNLRGSDPINYFVNELGTDLAYLNFVDLEKEVAKYFKNCYYEDCLANWVSGYDGIAYYFELNGVPQIMYRTE